ncbi:MAG: NADH-quinone oxidoreductase subunit NuoH [Dehalococcoidia bacterium]|nr:NADH-quinone oxidoreductase subunit NuoH [Dehalococcoidia bacterium]
MRIPLPFGMLLDTTKDAPESVPSGTRQRIVRVPVPGLRLVGAVVALVVIALSVLIGVIVVGGALDGKWYDFRDLGNTMDGLRSVLPECVLALGETCVVTGSYVGYLASAVIGGTGVLSFVGLILVLLVWSERRLLARFQVRRGPNRVGPFGLLQPLADAIKMMQKETVIPRGADRFLYYLPPVIVFIPLMLLWGAVPWAPKMTYADINVGVLYLVAVTSLTTLAIFLAGWSSNNHYALLGAMRTVAMMVSYEIPISISLLTIVLFTGSLQLTEIVRWQAEHNAWFAFLLPLPLFTFFFSSTAELNRSPNDIAEAESEIVAGYYTEYSGMKMGLYLAGELGYATATSAFVSTLFLGGWTLFGLETWIPPYVILGLKISVVYFVLVWMRATLPRFRLDQLMAFAWKYLIPLSIASVMLVALEVTLFARWDVAAIVPLVLFAIVNYVFARIAMRRWATVLGYQPELQANHPVMTSGVGGLRAAQALRQAEGAR